MTPFLDRLFGGSPGSFATDHYPRRRCMAHGPLARLGALGTWPIWQDPAMLVDALAGDVVIGYARSADAGPFQGMFRRDAWRSLYDAGVTVELLASDTPPIRALCDDVAGELGVAPSLVSADVFLSAAGEGVPKHYDGVDVIAIQLGGTKSWQLAANPGVTFPTSAYIPGFGSDIRNRRSTSDVEADTSTEMPATAETVVLEPGSAVFVPRGWWHQTHAIDDSISLSIVIRTPTIGDVLREAIARNMQADAAWREPVAVRASPALTARVDPLFSQLRADLPTLTAEIAGRRRFRRALGVAIEVASDARSVTIARGSARMQMQVPDYVARLFAWVARAPASFSASDAYASFPPGCGDWLESELATMAEQRVLDEL